MKKILVLDNYDSFTYNLVHLVEELGLGTCDVVRNDKIALDSVAAYDKILLSPGPGIPEEAGLMPELVRRYAPTKSIFGVCLGHQCIGEIFGGMLVNLSEPYHARACPTVVLDRDERLFAGLPDTFLTGRYHSWVVSPEKFPAALVITAQDERGAVMGLRHRAYDVRGVQFHPESVLTEHGAAMMRNWLAG